jgi:hypothetical protein
MGCPVSLLSGFALLLLDIEMDYGYCLDHFWACIPYGYEWARDGAVWLLVINLAAWVVHALVKQIRQAQKEVDA